MDEQVPLVEEQPDATEALETISEVPTPDAESTPETHPTPTLEEPKEPRFQRRINQLTRKIHDLERQVAAPPVSPPTIAVEEPQEAEFADYGQYVRALTKWEVSHAAAEHAREGERQYEEQRVQAISREFAPQMEAAQAKYEDFEEVVNQPIFTPLTQEFLLQSPQGAEIAYYLGTHLKEAAEVRGLSPMATARRLVALEAKVHQANAPAKTVSTAPAPITPVSGTPAAVKDPDKMTTDEWMVHERQQRLERLKTRPFV